MRSLSPDGVRVCALCPGPVETEFFGRAGMPDGYFPTFLVRSAERVAREGYEGFMAGHRVVVPGKPNRIMTLLPRLLPRGAHARDDRDGAGSGPIAAVDNLSYLHLPVTA